MKVLKFSALLFIIVFITSCTKTKTEYYKNGTIRSEVKYKGGKKNGRSVYFYENGMKELEINYIDDSADGQANAYYYKGTIKRIDNFKDNKLTGVSTTWDEELGFKFSEETYLNNVLNGPYKEYHQNGEVKVNGSYKNGFYDGKWSYFDERGVPVGEGNYNNGDGVLKGFYPTGKPLREINFSKNKKNGKETHWDVNGLIEKIIYFSNDKIDSIVTTSKTK